MFTTTTLFDFSGSLAILGLLAVAYGTLYKVIPNKRFVAPLLGILFGFVAVLQMNSPVEPYPGLIIDMRNVPVVLAGAFLGGRGLVACLLIAAIARVEIGGVGAMSGLAAMLIAGGVGLAWQSLVSDQRRGLVSFGVLGCMTSLHMIAAVLLPLDLARWFLQEAALLLVALNFICVTAVAALLERERRQILQMENLARKADFMTGERLMSRDAFDWALGQAVQTGSLRNGGSAVAVRFRFQGVLARLWGQDAESQAREEALYMRLDAVMPAGGIVGWARKNVVIIVIPPIDAEEAQNFLTQIRRDVSSTHISLPGQTAFSLVLDLDIKHYESVPKLDDIVECLSPETVSKTSNAAVSPAGPGRFIRPRQPLPADRNASAQRQQSVDEKDLFFTLDQLRAARSGAS